MSCLFDLINCGAKMAGLDLVHTDLDIFEIAIYYVTWIRVDGTRKLNAGLVSGFLT